MKCDELKALIFSIADLAYVDEIRVTKNFQNPHDHAVYKAAEADEAIAELKAENERLKKKMDEYHLMSDIRRAKIKELKRALWLARAERAQEMAWNFHEKNLVEKCAKWDNVHLMCRAKAEEYK